MKRCSPRVSYKGGKKHKSSTMMCNGRRREGEGEGEKEGERERENERVRERTVHNIVDYYGGFFFLM